MKYIPLFILLQIVNIPLMVLGWFICLLPYDLVPWLWGNDVDFQLLKTMTYWQRYVYIAWRNPVNNLRFVRGVSRVGRPLWRYEWGVDNVFMFPGYYAQAGWNNSGFPVLSAGVNVNPF